MPAPAPDLILVANGPGEVASWVRPVVEAWRARYPGGRIVVALVPCPWASGREAQVVRAWPEPPTVWPPGETLRTLATRRFPGGWQAGSLGVVLHLGGDQAFTVALGHLLRWPVLVYTETHGRWRRRVSRYLAADTPTRQRLQASGIPAARIGHVGRLEVDAVPPVASQAPGAPVVALLPGSKPFKLRWVTPLFLAAADALQARHAGPEAVVLLSPYTTVDDLAEAASHPTRHLATGGTTAQLERTGGGSWLVTRAGTRIRVVDHQEARDFDARIVAALTLPGTNTAELAVRGIPMVVALPLHRPEVIPVEGLLGRLGGLPVLGPWIMRRLAAAVLARRPLVALPNQRAGREVTPEVLGACTPEELAGAVSGLLEDEARRGAIARELREAMGDPGAAARVVAALEDVVRSPSGDAPRDTSKNRSAGCR